MPIYPSDLDIPAFQLRRAIASTVSNYVPAEGEPVWSTDTKQLFVGDGTTQGGIPLSNVVSTVTDQTLFTTSSVTFSALTVTNTATLGTLKLVNIANSTATTILYYDASTDQVSYSTIAAGGGAGNPFDQTLNTSSNVTFASLSVTTGTMGRQVIAAGGYSLDGNGRALIRNANTQSPALIVSNDSSGLLPEIVLRGYGQNRPGGLATTSATPAFVFEGSRGTPSSPTAVGSGDTLWAIGGGGYDGSRWAADSGFVTSQIFALSTEAFAGNATTTTNAGSRFGFRVQPQGAQMNSTSRQTFLATGWTAGSTATSTPPTMNINIGVADNTTPTLIPSGGAGSFGTGYGLTNVNFINTRNYIIGVPSQDSAPDNASLVTSNQLSFVSGRRSGASGRRNTIQKDDDLLFIDARGQTANNATGLGSQSGVIKFTALENFSGSVRGSRLTLQTTNTGTNTLSARLTLDDALHVHNSGQHQFNNAAGTTTYLQILSTATVVGDGTSTATIIANGGNRDLQLTNSNGTSNGGSILITNGAAGGIEVTGGANKNVLLANTGTFNVFIDGSTRLYTTAEGMHMAQKYWTIGKIGTNTEAIVTTAEVGQDLHLTSHNNEEGGGKIILNTGVANGVTVFAGSNTQVASFNTGTITLTAGVVKMAVTDLEGPTGADFNIVADGTNNINLNADTIRMGDNNTTATITTHGTADLKLDPSNGKILLNKDVSLKGFHETVVDLGTTSGTITVDATTATVFKMTLNGAVTIDTFNTSTAVAGQSVTYIIKQDNTGSRTLSSTMKFVGGSKTLTTTANAIDMITVLYDGSDYLAALSKGYA